MPLKVARDPAPGGRQDRAGGWGRAGILPGCQLLTIASWCGVLPDFIAASKIKASRTRGVAQAGMKP
jgi:hypothetical protein